MRRVLLLILMISTGYVFGQNHLVGIKSGINVTNVHSNYMSEQQFRPGFVGGITYEYQLSKKFNIGLDLIYAQTGYRYDMVYSDEFGNIIGEGVTSDYNNNYLSIPLKAGFSIGDSFYGFVNLGFVPSLLINAKITVPTIDNLEGETFNNTESQAKFGLASIIELGAGYKFNGKYVLCTSFGYQYSFTTMAKSGIKRNIINRLYGMTFSIGVKYNLRNK